MINIRVVPIFEELPDYMIQNSYRASTIITTRKKQIEVYEEAPTRLAAKRKLIKLLNL